MNHFPISQNPFFLTNLFPRVYIQTCSARLIGVYIIKRHPTCPKRFCCRHEVDQQQPLTSGHFSFHQTLRPILSGQYKRNFGPVNPRTEGQNGQEIAEAVSGQSLAEIVRSDHLSSSPISGARTSREFYFDIKIVNGR